jgi:hypothetical protein
VIDPARVLSNSQYFATKSVSGYKPRSVALG